MTLLAPVLLMIAFLGGLMAVISVFRRVHARPDRRSPLTEGLLRPPGHSLSEKIHDLQWDVGGYVAASISLPLLLYAMYLQSMLSGHDAGPMLFVIMAIIALATFLLVSRRLFVAIGRVRNLRLGWEAELAAAEEINRLMLRGYLTFHDVPGGKDFNLDHVVVGRTGVFVVETKGRPKKARGSGKAGSTVRYDGRELTFPEWQETKPLDQVRSSSVWLSRWLGKATGEHVPVTPIVLLPGWWVKRTGKGDVWVGNPKEIGRIVDNDNDRNVLTEKACAQIVHQLDQRCRSIAPRAYEENA